MIFAKVCLPSRLSRVRISSPAFFYRSFFSREATSRFIRSKRRGGRRGTVFFMGQWCIATPCNAFGRYPARIASREIVPDGVLLTPFPLGCFVSYRKASACFAHVLKTPSWLAPLALRSTISHEAMRMLQRKRMGGR